MDREYKFKRGDIILSTMAPNDFVAQQPILVLKNMTGDSKVDSFCNLCIGKSCKPILYWQNPDCAKFYDGPEEDIRYQILKNISKFILGELTDIQLETMIGKIYYFPIIKLLNEYKENYA